MSLADRTDEQKITQAPLLIVLGGAPTPVRPLTIRRSREWKKRVGEMFADLAQMGALDDVGATTPDALRRKVDAVVATFPGIIEALVLAYLAASDPTWTEERFVDTATDVEVTDALMTLIQATFPFLWKVGDLVRIAKAITG